ncbi:MAG: hypothetical protein ACREMD_05260 [Gemmatimonadota bacterium]
MTSLTQPLEDVTFHVTMGRQQRLLRHVFRRMPASMTALAKAAGLSHVALLRARRGDFDLESDRLRTMADVLRGWGETSIELADRLEEFAEQQEVDDAEA